MVGSKYLRVAGAEEAASISLERVRSYCGGIRDGSGICDRDAMFDCCGVSDCCGSGDRSDRSIRFAYVSSSSS